MNTAAQTRLAILALIISSVSISGCLENEVAASTSVANDDTPVNPVNNAPTISGSPETTIMLDGSYSFTPTASDADGDTLTFSAQNLPDWASFDAATGEVSGQPTQADVGVYESIIVSVSDGNESASLPEFSITVSQVALGSMTLTWTPPVENTDGSALTNLAGYRIYYGLSVGNYNNQVNIDTAGISSYVIDSLVPNTYYVVATSVNSMGVESAYSNYVVKTVEGS